MDVAVLAAGTVTYLTVYTEQLESPGRQDESLHHHCPHGDGGSGHHGQGGQAGQSSQASRAG